MSNQTVVRPGSIVATTATATSSHATASTLTSSAAAGVVPALPWTTNRTPDFDTDYDLLSWVYEHETYQAWESDGGHAQHTWQLRVTGEPGCGKTTFSAMTLQRLQAEFANRHDVAIACVFFDRQIVFSADVTVRLFLSSIYRSLERSCADSNPDDNPDVNTTADGAGDGDGDDCFANTDVGINGLRSILAAKIRRYKRVYLLLDDIDLCGYDLIRAIEAELKILQGITSLHEDRSMVKIMVTSRIPMSRERINRNCEALDDEHQRATLTLYWACVACEPSIQHIDKYTVCKQCRETVQTMCPLCKSTEDFIEPYDIREIELSHEPAVLKFVAREFERAHGDLNLGSELSTKPSLSIFGRAVVGQNKLGSAGRDVTYIKEQSYANVALAKLLLDRYQSAQAQEDIEQRRDSLGKDLIAFFDSAIRGVQNKPRLQERDLGLAVIAAVCHMFYEKSFELLRNWLVKNGLLDAQSSDMIEDDLHRVLYAANGLIKAFPDRSSSQDDEVQSVWFAPYHGLFGMYVTQGYNSELDALTRQKNCLGETGPQ